MTLLLESFCDIENYDICALIPRTATVILTSNKYGIANKIENYCKKSNLSIMIINPYDEHDIRHKYLYIDLVTSIADSGIILAKEYTKEIKEYQITGQHKNKRILYISIC